VTEIIDAFKSKKAAANACLALVKIGPPALPALIDAMKDMDPTVRMWAAITLGEMGKWAADAVPALAFACADSSPDVRKAASEALAKIRP
jgi:HEAT repeat protein